MPQNPFPLPNDALCETPIAKELYAGAYECSTAQNPPKQIRIKAKSEKSALKKAKNGDWFDSQVEKEDVVDRQAEEIIEE